MDEKIRSKRSKFSPGGSPSFFSLSTAWWIFTMHNHSRKSKRSTQTTKTGLYTQDNIFRNSFL